MKDVDFYLNKFYEEYHDDEYKNAILCLKKISKKEKHKSFWIYSRLSSCYYELKDYSKALRYAKTAFKLMPNSPLVLWDYAGPEIMLNKELKGIKLLKIIQNMEDDLTIYGFPDSNLKWMRKLKNDCNYLIGYAYYRICEDDFALKYFNLYLDGREMKIGSIYRKKDANKYLKKIQISG